MPSDLPKLEWTPAEDEGWEAEIGVLWFAITPDPITLTVGWDDDFECEPCESLEHAKRRAIDLGVLILCKGIETLERSRPGKECRDFCPPGYTGRWRDWHRGKGCALDDGRARTEAGAAEIAALGVDHG